MKNITVSLDDDLYRKARVAAAETDCSVTALVREFLTVLTTGKEVESASESSEKASRAILKTIEEIRQRHPGFNPTQQMSRDEVHAR